MEKNDFFDVIGPLLMLIGIAFFVYFFVFRDLSGLILGIIFGIVGIAIVCLFKKTNGDTILSILMFFLSALISIINIPEIIAGMLIIICSASSMYFVLKPP